MELAPFVAAVAQEQRDLYVAFLASLGIDDNVAAIDIELLAAELQSLRDSVDDRFEAAEEEHLPMDPRAREPRAAGQAGKRAPSSAAGSPLSVSRRRRRRRRVASRASPRESPETSGTIALCTQAGSGCCCFG